MSYCKTCGTMENVGRYTRLDGTDVWLCADCRRDFWQGFTVEGARMGEKPPRVYQDMLGQAERLRSDSGARGGACVMMGKRCLK